MAVTLNAVIDESSLSADYEHLKRCWASQVEANPNMQMDWAEIGKMVYSSPSPPEHYADPYSKEAINAETERLRQSLSRAKEIYAKLSDFKLRYVEFMNDSQVESLNRFTELALSLVNSSEAFQYFHKSTHNKKSIEKLRLMKIGMDLYSESLPINFSRQVDLVKHGLMSREDYEYSANLLKAFLLLKSNLADEIASSEVGFGHISEMRSLQKGVKDIAMSLLWQVSRISEGREPLGYIVSEFEGSVVVLESCSAEAKAIERTHRELNEEEWEVSYKPGDAVNISEIRNRLKQRING